MFVWSQDRVKAGRTVQGAGPCGGYGFLLPESCEAPGACAGCGAPVAVDPQLAPPRRSPEQPEVGWDPFHQALAGRGTLSQSLLSLNIPVTWVSPPATAGTAPPGKGREGRDLYRSQLLKQTRHTLKLTHTEHPHTPPSATERSVKPVSHTHSPFVQGSHVTVRPGRGSHGWDIVQESM